MVSNNTLLYISLAGIALISALTYSLVPDEDTIAQEHEATTPTGSTTEAISLSPPNQQSSDVAVQELQEKITQLQQQLNIESQNRHKLEAKLAKLEKALENSRFSNEKPHSDAADEDFPGTNISSRGTSSRGTSNNDPWFNEQALVEAGIDSSKISYIKTQFEQSEMEKLYLRDQATREGWINSPRYQDAAKAIADKVKNLRKELTDDEYDAYLYASGSSNRVIVSSVLGNSPAAGAGIQQGDIILKYDNERVYNWTDLTSATSKGDSSNTVTVTIIRDGQQQVVYIPRGPMGVKLSMDSMAP